MKSSSEVLLLGGGTAEVAEFGACLRGEDVRLLHLPRVPTRPPDRAQARLVVWWMQGGVETETIRRLWPGVPLLGVLAPAAVAGAPEDAAPDGPDDFLVLPVRPPELLRRVRRLLRAGGAGEPAPSGPPLIGASQSFRATLAQMALIAAADATVLITGETGTGKELLARAVHYHSARCRAPFVPVNCGALPDTLFENELFGHARGAYTDARSEQRGLLEEAEGGTLLLDEVDALSAAAQVKLLRFIQEREFRRLGCSRPLRANVRVIAASNAVLGERVREGSFREDLYYRLNVLPLRLPPLRQRAGDIELLAGHFLQRHARGADGAAWRLSDTALERLRAHAWPGNVRELEVVLQRSVVLAGGRPKTARILACDDLLIDARAAPADGTRAPLAGLPFEEAKQAALSDFEQRYLTDVLDRHAGNVTRAASSAGKDRRTFQRLLQKHHLDRSTFQV